MDERDFKGGKHRADTKRQIVSTEWYQMRALNNPQAHISLFESSRLDPTPLTWRKMY